MRCRDCLLIGFSTAPQDGEARSIVFVTVSAVFIPALPVPGSHPRRPGSISSAAYGLRGNSRLRQGDDKLSSPTSPPWLNGSTQKRLSSTGTNCGCAAMIVASQQAEKRFLTCRYPARRLPRGVQEMVEGARPVVFSSMVNPQSVRGRRPETSWPPLRETTARLGHSCKSP